MTLTETIELYFAEQRRIIDSFPVDVLARAAEQLFDTYGREPSPGRA